MAISARLAGDSALALAGAPFGPPSFPRATAAGFFSRASILPKTRLASNIGSVVLERLGTASQYASRADVNGKICGGSTMLERLVGAVILAVLLSAAFTRYEIRNLAKLLKQISNQLEEIKRQLRVSRNSN